MISYKVKGIILVVIISLASIMMPFSVYADTISASNIVGVNVELLGSSLLEHRTETVQTNTYNYYLNQYTYKAVIELDNSYVGVIGARVQGNYYDKAPSQGSTVRTESLNHYRKIYVNGNTAEMTFVITSWISSYDDPLIYRADGTSPYVTIEDSNVTKFEDIDSIEQIIDLLSDIYQNSNDIEGLSTNQLTELQKIVSNTSLANDYLELISQIRQYNIPFESLTFILYLLSQNYQIQEYSDIYYTNYPRFTVPSGSALYGFNGSTTGYTKSLDLIFLTNKTIRNTTELNNLMSINNGELIFVKTITNGVVGTTGNYLIQIRATNFTSSGRKEITVNSLNNIVPICAFYTDLHYFSTEFALQFGLSNSLLDNIQIIANGTQQSNSAASDLEQEASEYSDIADDLIGVEEGLTSNFETSVNQIDLNTGLNGFGGNFMTSATWVRTQFDRLTENTPYGSLVVYGLTLGFVLLMLGKVLL